MSKIKFNPGFFSGIGLALENGYLEYINALNLNEYGRVPIKSIKAVVIEPGKTFSTVKLIGEGTTLGYFSTGINYAQKCQTWLMEQLGL